MFDGPSVPSNTLMPKEEVMTKDEWIWVAIRIFGIYLVVLALRAIPDVIGSFYAASQLTEVLQSDDILATSAKAMKSASLTKGLTSVAKLLVFSLFGFYFIRHGKFLHRLASSEKA